MNEKTFMVVLPSWHVLQGGYKTAGAAKAALTRKWLKRYADAKVMDSETFQKDEPMVETRNILTGGKCMIKASQAGGCCDPSTERYHSM